MSRFFSCDLSNDYELRKLFYSLKIDGAGALRVAIEEWNDAADSGRISPDWERARDLSELEFRSEFARNPQIIAAFEQASRDRQP